MSISLFPNVTHEDLQIKNTEEYKTNYINIPSFYFTSLLLQTKSNDIFSKIKALNNIIMHERLFFGWSVYNNRKDTLSIRYYNLNTDQYGFPPIPIIIQKYHLSTLKFKIINDTLFKFLEFSDGNIENPYNNKNYSDSNYYFKFYKTDARIDFSKSFFNTNKSYLRYCERMHRKEEKRKKKLTTALH